jgi:hypothetical protein
VLPAHLGQTPYVPSTNETTPKGRRVATGLGDSEIADAVRFALPLQTKHVECVASASLDLAASEDPDEEA